MAIVLKEHGSAQTVNISATEMTIDLPNLGPGYVYWLIFHDMSAAVELVSATGRTKGIPIEAGDVQKGPFQLSNATFKILTGTATGSVVVVIGKEE